MKKLIIIALGLTVFSGICLAAEKLPLPEEKDKVSYSIGYQVGGDLKRQNVELNAEALMQGAIDGFTEKGEPALSPEKMQEVLVALKKKLDAESQQQQEAPEATKESYPGEDREFLAANAKIEGVVILPSGLQYTVVQKGDGPSPQIGDTVTVHYRGTLVDGREFDSSYRDDKPATFQLDKVIPGWREALPMMKEGGKWKIFIPSDLAFGERGPLRDRVVIYEIELLKVESAKS